MTLPARHEVDARACIRCGACASVAPELFAVDGPVARVLREPAGEAEQRACAAALLLCPTSAVRRREVADGL